MKPPYHICARGDAFAAPLFTSDDVLFATVHDAYGDPCAVLVRVTDGAGGGWLLSIPDDQHWRGWAGVPTVWKLLGAGQPGRLRFAALGVLGDCVIYGAKTLELYDQHGRLTALMHKVLSADTWAFTSRDDADWKNACARFGYAGDT